MGFIYQNLFVENLDALAALTNTSTPKRVDGVFFGVEDNTEGYPGWYRYYPDSLAADDRPSVVASDDSIGAWFSFSGAGSSDPGQSAYTTTTASYVQPAVGSNVTVSVASSSWLAVGETVFISSGGTYSVASIPTATSVSLTNLAGYSGNAVVGSTIATGRSLVASGIKGDAGDQGLDGVDGQSAYTATTASYVQPIVGSNVTVPVVNSAWMSPGETVFISNGGTYTVFSIPTATSVSLTNLAGYSGNAAVGSTVPTTQSVVASGIKGDTGDPGVVTAASALILNPTSTPPTTDLDEVAIFADTANRLHLRNPSDGTIREVGDRTVPARLFLLSILK